MMRPMLDSNKDGDEEVDNEDGEDEEMYGWVHASVVFVTLECGHS